MHATTEHMRASVVACAALAGRGERCARTPGQCRIGPRSSPGSCRMEAERRPLALRTSIIFVSTEREPCMRRRQSVPSMSGLRLRDSQVFRPFHQLRSRSRLRRTHCRAAEMVDGVHRPASSSTSGHGSGGSGDGRWWLGMHTNCASQSVATAGSETRASALGPDRSTPGALALALAARGCA
jgi:hypothetical protein